ncbi:hypothetical protein HQQ94_08250 [Shewanella sp. VB17]|uniref:hypothetical protein n=1 Tax=Shewanella sp. VB17 TaxID=2739432 RepID=UPI0015668533|nr:hypothetical protein [Shewanella sp. VB17]NRD73233.1 hypothetical protein [Shewanella sp. VB17]
MKSTPQSLSINQVVSNEANRVIASLYLKGFSCEPTIVESVLESLLEIAQVAKLPVASQLNIRLIALRNKIRVNQIQMQEVA